MKSIGFPALRDFAVLMNIFTIHFHLLAGLFLASCGFLQAGSPPAADYNLAIKATPLLSTTTTASGQPIEYPKTDKPEVSVLLVEIPPGAETGWHKHPSPCYAYILSGTVTVELEGGKSYTFHAGQAFAETVNILHNGKNTGVDPVKIIMTVTGQQGLPIAVNKKSISNQR